MAKNVLMKYYNPATQTYQEVHPLTKTTNVYNNEGKTVQELIDEHKAEIVTTPQANKILRLDANAKLPALFKKINAGAFAPPIYCSTINEIAIKIPPPITNGSMCEIPFINCL